MARYDHTQQAPLWRILVAVGIGATTVAVLFSQRPPALFVGGIMAFVMFLTAGMFGHLRVWDEGSRLRVKFGPLPFFGTHIDYAKMTGVHREKSRFIDGWGIHSVPPKGMIINIWGRDCIAIEFGPKKMVRIGTDDPDGLEALLQGKLDNREDNL